ncbi:tail fiber domain-containing protein [Caballeronia sp. GAFFF2]|uniref:tail fiber domain-containing protein n=1 Tax=Caballeronia sp. GAFFF2 TaxID=2921741 RepID=UPI0020293FD3|nr:tail fiber domain-containing protein [Caballeronia sp. GAFFF2]
MSTLQKVNLGTPPTAVDGDTVRGANTKANANVDVLNAQATLTSAAATITSAQALTAAHVGKRVNINLAAAGTINLPSAATMGLDGIVHLRNQGSTLVTLAIASGSGDTIALTSLAAGESTIIDSDGIHTLGCLMRSRTYSANETVSGALTVGGNIAIAPLASTYSSQLTMVAPNGYTARVRANGTASLTEWVNTANSGVTMSLSDAGLLTAQSLAVAGAANFNGTTVFGGGSTTVKAVGTAGAITMKWQTGSGAIGQIQYDQTSFGFSLVNSANSAYITLTCLSVTQTSDAALKTAVVPYTSVLEKLRDKRIVNYRMKIAAVDGGGVGPLQVGVIAQEWKDDFPELVSENGAEIDSDGDFVSRQFDEDGVELLPPSGPIECRRALTFNYSQASAVAIQGVVEVDAEVQYLKSALASALDRIAVLESKVSS